MIIVINGCGGSGKDTFIELIKKKRPELLIKNLSTVDKIKDCATILGWNGQKDEKSRKFLSDLKDLSAKYNDGPYNYIKNCIENTNIFYDMFFIHSREPNEIEKFAKNLKVLTVFIDASKRVPHISSNHADDEVENYNYDYYIDNNGSYKDLEDTIKTFLNEIGI